MKKRLVVYGTLAFVVLTYGGYLAIEWYFSDNVTQSNYDRLEIGMTKWQVRKTLGPWPNKSYQMLKGQIHENWLGPEGGIMLAFDDRDRLIWKTWLEGSYGPTPFLEWVNGIFWITIVRD